MSGKILKKNQDQRVTRLQKEIRNNRIRNEGKIRAEGISTCSIANFRYNFIFKNLENLIVNISFFAKHNTSFIFFFAETTVSRTEDTKKPKNK